VLGHLEALPDGSLGGLFAAQVIEHMSTDGLVALVRLAHAKLAPAGASSPRRSTATCLATFSGPSTST